MGGVKGVPSKAVVPQVTRPRGYIVNWNTTAREAKAMSFCRGIEAGPNGPATTTELYQAIGIFGDISSFTAPMLTLEAEAIESDAFDFLYHGIRVEGGEFSEVIPRTSDELDIAISAYSKAFTAYSAASLLFCKAGDLENAAYAIESLKLTSDRLAAVENEKMITSVVLGALIDAFEPDGYVVKEIRTDADWEALLGDSQ